MSRKTPSINNNSQLQQKQPVSAKPCGCKQQFLASPKLLMSANTHIRNNPQHPNISKNIQHHQQFSSSILIPHISKNTQHQQHSTSAITPSSSNNILHHQKTPASAKRSGVSNNPQHKQ